MLVPEDHWHLLLLTLAKIKLPRNYRYATGNYFVESTGTGNA
jgi:hypothetical protein